MTTDKEVVRNYFNTVGFDRWRRIYGDDSVNKVQLDIRTGHQQTIDYVLQWLKKEENISQQTICDAGCGVGSLSLPLAALGAKVFASDISQQMVTEAQKRSPHPENPVFAVSDLEGLSGEYDTVICLDVLIHYPLEQAEAMIRHLTTLAKLRFIISFAPKNTYYTLLKKVGELFPGAKKATRAYLHAESDIKRMLAQNGFQVKRKELICTQFYFSRLLEAVRN
jgi:magnesium-protoporphyrin O-methyltransferase